MRVLHVEAGRHLYGGAAQVLMLLRGLAALPGEHRLVCAEGSAVENAARRTGIAVLPVPMRGDLDISLVLRLRGLIRRERPHLIHVHSRRGADFWGGLAAARLPAVLSRRVDNPDNLLQRQKYRLYRRVIAISAAIARLLVEREGLAPERVVCIPSAVDCGRFRPSADRAADRARLCREFNLDRRCRILAVVAQLIDRKGHAALLQGLPAVLSRHPDVRLLLFGRGPLEAELRQLCAELGLGGQVVFAGLRDDIARLLPAVELLIHPARREGLGVALLEAAACAVPIVAGAAGGVPEIVRDGVNGRLLPSAEPRALSAAINGLLDQPEFAARLGRRGREIALAEFSVERMVRDNHRVYRQLLGAPGAA